MMQVVEKKENYVLVDRKEEKKNELFSLGSIASANSPLLLTLFAGQSFECSIFLGSLCFVSAVELLKTSISLDEEDTQKQWFTAAGISTAIAAVVLCLVKVPAQQEYCLL